MKTPIRFNPWVYWFVVFPLLFVVVFFILGLLSGMAFDVFMWGLKIGMGII